MIKQGTGPDEWIVLLPHERRTVVNKIVAKKAPIGLDERQGIVYSLASESEYVIADIAEFNQDLLKNEN